MINDNNIMSLCNLDDNNNEFIYLIKEREFIKTKEHIYKIGKTKQENLQRIKSYPNGSILLLYIITNDCDKKEKEIIQKFKEHFIHKKDIGNEYFMGDYNHMINIILSIISISSSIESIVFFDYDNKIINFDNSHIKDIEFIKNDKLEYYELFELYYNKLFENDNKSYSKILTKTKQWINKMDESIYRIIILRKI